MRVVTMTRSPSIVTSPIAVQRRALAVIVDHIQGGATNTTTVTLRLNSVSTTLTCSTNGAANGACSDTTHSVVVHAGDELDLRSTSISGPVVWAVRMAPS